MSTPQELGLQDENDPEWQAMLAQKRRQQSAQMHAPAPVAVAPTLLDMQPKRIPMQSPAPAMMVDRSSGLMGSVGPGQTVTRESKSTTTQRSPFTKAEQKDFPKQLDTAVDDKRKAVTDEVAAKEKAATADAAAYAKQGSDLDRLHGEERAAQNAGNLGVKAAEDEYHKRVEEYRAAKPTEFWGTQSTADKITAGIGLFLGALGSGAAGKEYQAVEVIKNKINAHARAEENRIAKMKDISDYAQGGMARADKRKADLIADVNIRKAAQLERAKLDIEQRAAQNGFDMAKVNGSKALAELGAEAVQSKMTAISMLRDKSQSTKSSMEVEGGAGAQIRPGADRNVYGRGGEILGQTRDPKSAAMVNKVIPNLRTFDELLGKLEESYAKGRLLPGSKEAEERSSLVKATELAVKNNEELGAIVGGDWGIIHGQIGDGGALFAINPMERIKTTRASARAKGTVLLDSSGLNGKDVLPRLFDGVEQTGGGGDSEAIQWAKANQGDQRAQRILKANGL